MQTVQVSATHDRQHRTGYALASAVGEHMCMRTGVTSVNALKGGESLLSADMPVCKGDPAGAALIA
jgi:hypothetical protein